jgi:hypothetical protein
LILLIRHIWKHRLREGGERGSRKRLQILKIFKVKMTRVNWDVVAYNLIPALGRLRQEDLEFRPAWAT